jgi:branched-chain amino acid transport system ATP-binding protein
MSLLEVKNLNSFYGSMHILFDISLSVETGEIVCIIGRNNAGKTTLLLSIIGLLKSITGKIIFDGKDITGLPVYKRVKMGISYVPDYRGIFSSLTTLQNLRLATLQSKQSDLELAFKYFPELYNHLNKKGGSLSGGERTICSIARAIIQQPKLLLLDEPSGGLAPIMRDRISNILKELKKRNISMLIVEENVDVALELADTIFVLQEGRIVFRGNPEKVGEFIKERKIV